MKLLTKAIPAIAAVALSVPLASQAAITLDSGYFEYSDGSTLELIFDGATVFGVGTFDLTPIYGSLVTGGQMCVFIINPCDFPITHDEWVVESAVLKVFPTGDSADLSFVFTYPIYAASVTEQELGYLGAGPFAVIGGGLQISPAPIPVPAAGWLFMTALLGLVGNKNLSCR